MIGTYIFLKHVLSSLSFSLASKSHDSVYCTEIFFWRCGPAAAIMMENLADRLPRKAHLQSILCACLLQQKLYRLRLDAHTAWRWQMMGDYLHGAPTVTGNSRCLWISIRLTRQVEKIFAEIFNSYCAGSTFAYNKRKWLQFRCFMSAAPPAEWESKLSQLRLHNVGYSYIWH